MEVFIKHQRGRRQRTWDISQYTVHMAGHNGRPYCKNGRPDCLPDGRLSPRGWRQINDCDPMLISCKSCLQRLERDALETSLEPLASLQPKAFPSDCDWYWLVELRYAESLRYAHLCLAAVFASSLTDEEITTYQQSGFFQPSQCWRLWRILVSYELWIDPAILGLQEPTSPTGRKQSDGSRFH